MKYFIIAALIAATSAVDMSKRIHHPSKQSNVRFSEGMTDDEVDGYDFFAQQRAAAMAAPEGPQAMSQLPTCDKFETWNCQPVCTESLTMDCTEAATPNAPNRDRFEGRRTFKGPEKTESPWST